MYWCCFVNEKFHLFIKKKTYFWIFFGKETFKQDFPTPKCIQIEYKKFYVQMYLYRVNIWKSINYVWTYFLWQIDTVTKNFHVQTYYITKNFKLSPKTFCNGCTLNYRIKVFVTALNRQRFFFVMVWQFSVMVLPVTKNRLCYSGC